jgi:hypothetical protein
VRSRRHAPRPAGSSACADCYSLRRAGFIIKQPPSGGGM